MKNILLSLYLLIKCMIMTVTLTVTVTTRMIMIMVMAFLERKLKKITCRLKFVDSCRFMQDSLLNLVDNLSEINNRKLDKTESFITSLLESIDYYRKTQDSYSAFLSTLSIFNDDKFAGETQSMITSINQCIESCRFM